MNLSRVAKGAAFCIILFTCFSCQKTQPKEEKKFPVTIGDVVQKDVPIFIDTIGNVYSLYTVEIRPQVGGIIQEALVKQGDYVKKGQKLFQIDPRPYKAALDQAYATLVKDQAAQEYAQIAVNRYSTLTQESYYSQINYEQLLTNLETTKGQVLDDIASIEIAKLNLDWTAPTSPFDGKISQYNIDPGNLVVTNDTNFLTTVRMIDPADIRFSIAQKDFVEFQKSVRAGQLKFQVFLPQDMKNPQDGTIYFVDNSIDTNTGTILLRGTVPNKDEFFWPGEFVKVRLIFKIAKNGILVPEESVGIGQDGAFVFVYKPDNSTVELRKVTKGETYEHLTLIEKGVNVGEKVVVKGQLNLQPGVKVYIPSNPSQVPANSKSSGLSQQ